MGFADLSVRDDVPTLQGTRTGYIEGLYVLPQARGRGVALKLLRAAQAWAHEQRCLAFASDRAGGIVIDGSFTTYRS
jgi:aminoglycoside 6'-N-acetyltransferase I